jgi:hypothetical protein
MDIPESCPEAYSSLIKRCWAHDPAERPTFADIALTIEEIYVPLAREQQ